MRTIAMPGLTGLLSACGSGGYAEGTFEVTLPVTDALLATVRREYRNAFAVR